MTGFYFKATPRKLTPAGDGVSSSRRIVSRIAAITFWSPIAVLIWKQCKPITFDTSSPPRQARTLTFAFPQNA